MSIDTGILANQKADGQYMMNPHNALFQAALDYVETPLLILDSKKNVVAATTAACAMIGTTMDGIVGKPLAECGNGIFTQRDPTGVELPLMALLQVSDRGPLAASSKVIVDPDGTTIGWIVTMHAASKPQIRRQRRMIPILPFLQPYFVNLQQLLMNLPALLMQPDDHQNAVIQMQRLLNEMILRVQRLVLLHSIEAQGEVRMDEIQIGKLIQQVLMELRGQSNKREIRFNVEIPESFSVLYCNVSQVRMALRELLENVLQHATDCSETWIQVCQRQGYVHLSVRDNGQGISEEKLFWLQGWFAQQDDNLRTERYEHIGFGLALVRAVAKAHHGDLRVESDPGIGSTFTLILPAMV